MVRTVMRMAAVAAGALAAAAVVQELSRPVGERSWHGAVAGVPYDFRAPTAERLRHAYWNPDNPELFPAHPFGVGWGLNLPRLAALAAGSSAGVTAGRDGDGGR